MIINYNKIFESIQDGSINVLEVHENENGNLCLHLPLSLSLENEWILKEKGEGFIGDECVISIYHPENFNEDYQYNISKSEYYKQYGKLPEGIVFVTPINRYDKEFFDSLKERLVN